MNAIENIKAEIKTWAADDRANGITVGSDGSLPEITAEMLGRRVDELGLDESAADALRIELMELWTRETAIAVDDDLCERWLGRDWPDTTTSAEAMRIATACQAKRDAGDSRDYAAILAEVIG